MSASKLVCICFWKPNIHACILLNASSIKTSAHNTPRKVWGQSRNPSVVPFLSGNSTSLQSLSTKGLWSISMFLAVPWLLAVPNPFVFMLLRVKNTVMVWHDDFSLGDICSLFFQENIPALLLTLFTYMAVEEFLCSCLLGIFAALRAL